jgi:hypothetical protein
MLDIVAKLQRLAFFRRLAQIAAELEENFGFNNPYLKKATNLIEEDHFNVLYRELLTPLHARPIAPEYTRQQAEAWLQQLNELIPDIPLPVAALKTALRLEAKYLTEQLEEEAVTIEAYDYPKYRRDIERLHGKFENVGRLPKLFVQKITALINRYENFGITEKEREQLLAFAKEYNAVIRQTEAEDLEKVTDSIVNELKERFKSYRQRLVDEGKDVFVEEMKAQSEIEEAYDQRIKDKEISDILLKFFVHRSFKDPQLNKQIQSLFESVPAERRSKLMAELNAIAGKIHKNMPGVSIEQLLETYKKDIRANVLLRMKTILAKLRISLNYVANLSSR